MNDRRITIEEWLEIAEAVVSEFVDRFSDDGKLSLADGLAILLTLLRAIVKASKNA